MNFTKKVNETQANLKRAALLKKNLTIHTKLKRNSVAQPLIKLSPKINISKNSHTKEQNTPIIPQKKSTGYNLLFKAKTPRLSIGYPKSKFDLKNPPRSGKNTENKIDYYANLIHKPDYRRTIIIDNEGNNNLNFKPKKLYSENDLFTKISKINFDNLWAKETALTETSNEIFSQKQRDEIDQIKPFEEDYNDDDDDDNDDDESKSDSKEIENKNILMTSFLSSEVIDMDKTIIQDNCIPQPLYTPRQLFTKNNKKIIVEQFYN